MCSRNSTNTPTIPESGNRCGAGNHPQNTSKLNQKKNRDVEQLSNVDHVPTNAHPSQGKSQLHIFEDAEAVIKMVIKGRSPTMRHVSRTQRVAIDRLFDRINLDSRVQIKCVGTKNQLADILAKGSFTRDQWNHVLCLLNSLNPSMLSCSHFFLSSKPKAKRHVKEKTGRQSWKGIGHVEAEIHEFGHGENKTCQFGTSKRVEYEEKLTARIERFQLPGECSNRTGQCFDRLLETEARYSPKSSRAFSSEEAGKYSNCGVLAAGKQERIFTINRRLETNARCGFTHEKVRNRVS